MSATNEPLGHNDHRYRQILTAVEAAADAVERGRIVTQQQLGELREATRRLRRGIEVYTISASVPCPECGELYVPVVSAAPCCTQTRQETSQPRSGRLSV